jgi:hypothetical protein
MKKITTLAIVLFMPIISFAETVGDNEVEQMPYQRVVKTDAERYKESVARKRAYLRSLYRKDYSGKRNNLSNKAFRKYDNSIDSWEKTRESIKTSIGGRVNTQQNYKYRTYEEYLEQEPSVQERAVKIKTREERS